MTSAEAGSSVTMISPTSDTRDDDRRSIRFLSAPKPPSFGDEDSDAENEMLTTGEWTETKQHPQRYTDIRAIRPGNIFQPGVNVCA